MGAAACGNDNSGPSGDFVSGGQDADVSPDSGVGADAIDDESSVIVPGSQDGGDNTANLASLNRLGGSRTGLT